MSKIIIVEDDPNIRELIRTLLINNGFEACEASDGRDALQKMTGEHPELAIIDLMMPNIDGFELCRAPAALQNRDLSGGLRRVANPC